ncbi:MAG: hypothetical protein FWC10_02220 [Lentimicrobiaceae bacterium]|nr:hypothetical protein [Lentimicrobiaceae bacterium]
MKKIGIFFVAALLISSVFCQDFDDLLTKKQVDCSDIAHNSSLHFIKYMTVYEVDSAKHLLDYWENRCGIREPIFRAKILLALITSECVDSLLTKEPLNQIFNYQSRMDMIRSARYYLYDDYRSYYGYIPPGEEFDIFTRQLAFDLKNNYTPESLEYVLAEFYSNNYDVILSKLQSKTLENCLLAKEYEKAVKPYKSMPEFHFALLAGIWIPTGALAQIGVHPDLGIQVGWKQRKINYDFTLTTKFADAPRKYYAKRNKKSEEDELTDRFFGGYIGFELSGDILSKKGHEIQIGGGGGYDGFFVLKEKKDENLKASATSSFNLNFGLAYRYYISHNFYLGLRVKYNIVDYTLNKVIDFTGNPITVQFSIGILRSDAKDEYLKMYGFKFRK